MSKTNNLLMALRIAAAGALVSGCNGCPAKTTGTSGSTKTPAVTTAQKETTFSKERILVSEWMRVGGDKGSCGTPRNTYAVNWLDHKNQQGGDSIGLLQVVIDKNKEDEGRLIAGKQYRISGTSVPDHAAAGKITTFSITPELLPEPAVRQAISTNPLKNTAVSVSK